MAERTRGRWALLVAFVAMLISAILFQHSGATLVLVTVAAFLLTEWVLEAAFPEPLG